MTSPDRVGNVHRDDVVGHQVVQQFEPPQRQLREHGTDEASEFTEITTAGDYTVNFKKNPAMTKTLLILFFIIMVIQVTEDQYTIQV